MQPKSIPFEFMLDYLVSPEISIKPVFGMFYVYAGKRIVLILRQREKDAHINGIWVATLTPHHKSLQKEMPALKLFSACGKEEGESAWLLLPADAKNFEACAIQLCRLVERGDKRIGRVVEKTRKKKIVSGIIT